MTQEQQHKQYLFNQYLTGQSSPEEWQAFWQMMSELDAQDPLHEYINTWWNKNEDEQIIISNIDHNQVLQRILANKQAITFIHQSPIRSITQRWIAAAFLILAIGSGIYYLNHQSYKSQESHQSQFRQKAQEAIPPGSNKAIWILTDGKQIELDSTVLDMTTNNTQASHIGYNELHTPRGGQYQLILPDGSKVWLNAASSIKYPVVFDGKERTIEVTGEAYIEVTKNQHQPFIVTTSTTTVQVLGTAFNIHAYHDEVTRISLAEGAIKVNDQRLKPGEAYKEGHVITTNIEQDLAWKNNLFNFNNLSFDQIMRQLERWYDIDVSYAGSIPQKQFTGEMYRDVNLSDVLALLTRMNIRYKQEGKKLVIL